jgi:hypothetical protein
MANFKKVQPNDPPWLKEAFKLLGLTEGKGAANNPDVLALHAEAGFAGVKADSVAWCAAFKGAMLRRAGYRASGSLVDQISGRSYNIGDRVVIRRAHNTVRLLHPEGHNYYDTLRQKLHWNYMPSEPRVRV